MAHRFGGKLPLLVIGVLASGFMASIFLNISQGQRATQDRNQLEGEITDLRYQLNQNKQALLTPTPSPLATPEPTLSPSPSPMVAGASTISFTQIEARLTVNDPITDLTYDMTTNGQYEVVGLSTRSLISTYPQCKPGRTNNALGQIVRKTTKTSTGTFIKKLGNWYYFYIAPSGYCASDPSGRDTLAAARAAVKNGSLPTLSN